MYLRPKPVDNLPIVAGIQPAEFCRNGVTLSLARRAMDPAHLFHSVLTRPSSAKARPLKSRHPFVRTTSHQSTIKQQYMCGALGRLLMECGVDEQTYKTPYFHSRHRHPHPRNDPSKEQPGSSLTVPHWCRTFLLLLADMGMASSAACEWGTEEQTADHVAFQFRFTDLHMDCTAWRFWTMRRANSCSKPVPRSSAAKQWFEELAQKMKKKKLWTTHTNFILF